MYFRDFIADHHDFKYLLDNTRGVKSSSLSTSYAIALSFSNTLDVIQALALVDGCVDKILLLPQNLSADQVNVLIEKSEVEYVFGEHPNYEACIDGLELKGTFLQALPTQTSQWLIATSGTTGLPKLVSHRFKSLSRTVKRSKSSRNFIWGQLYDDYRFAGLQVIIQAVVGGSNLISPGSSLKLCEKLKAFSDANVNALSATPTLWRKILMTPASEKLDLRSVTLGGEIVDQSILDALHRRYPKARIRHIYASTEAGAAFSVSDNLAGFPLSYLEQTVDGVRLKIESNKLLIHNGDVTTHYIGEDKTQFGDEYGFIDTNDMVKIDENRVHFLGRSSGMINVGGNKVMPEYVEQILNQVKGVILSHVYGKKSSLMGQLVVAEIQISEGVKSQDVELELKKIVKSELAPFQRPVLFKFVEKIELSDNGKVKR